MPYLYDAPNNTSGMDTILVDTVTAMPAFAPLLLLMVFFVVFLGGISRQKLRTGTADYSMWCIIASLSTLMLSLILTTITGILRLDWLIIIVAITILSGVWFFFDRRASEV